MNEDTILLLKEIDSGCFMAINSLHQMEEYEMSQKQHAMLARYVGRHDEIQKKVSSLLHRNEETDQQPGKMASAMSWLTTEMKMMLHNEGSQIAKIMMNGCNMGMQSIKEYITKYKTASDEAVALAKKLLKIEEEMLQEALEFI